MAKPPGPIIISLEAKILTLEEQQILHHKNIGGVILFTRNFENKLQITQLIKSIKEINPDILIMVDHEGGRVWRFKSEEFFNPGPMQVLGSLYHVDSPHTAIKTAFQHGRQIAADLLACGIDLNLAPVLDLDHDGISSVIGERAIHSDPTIVALLAESFIKGQLSVGMQSVGKHFPGHGAISADTHTEIAIDPRDYRLISEQDLKPFQLLIEQNMLPAIMPAHVIYPQVDPNPTCFSKTWLQQVLRKDLQFKGTIISDCLSMQAAQEFIQHQTSDPKEKNVYLANAALQAGCDLIIFNKLYGNNLLYLLDNISWEPSPEHNQRIDTLKKTTNYAPNKTTIRNFI